MISRRRELLSLLLCFLTCLISTDLSAVLFQPGVGIGLEATDNVKLTPDDTKSELIANTYVGASISENEGALEYNADARLSRRKYLQDTFPDKRYLNLNASADWAMIKDHVDWFLRDRFSQRTIVALNANTPDNLQDSNVFTLGVNIRRPSASRHSFSLTPRFDQYYYEQSRTNNRQYSLAANWNYLLSRRTQTGISLKTKEIDYFESQFAGVRFNTLSALLSGQSKRTGYALSLGNTSVERDTGEATSGFSGFVRFSAELSSSSSLNAVASTSLTDTSSVTNAPDLPPGSGDDVQIVTDVVRNSNAGITYTREDASLRSSVWVRYGETTYSDNPLDRKTRGLGIRAAYPVQPLLVAGAYINYDRSNQLVSGREDERYRAGGDLNYSFSRKLRGTLDVEYRTKDSNVLSQNYDEFSVFASLVYGFGSVPRGSQAGGG